MPQLRFEGNSDDTFGEYGFLRDDFDNCASGHPIDYLVKLNDNEAMIVRGQYCPGDASGWMIGVARATESDDVPMPQWPMRFELSGMEYSPRLVIDVPEGVVVTCLNEDDGYRERLRAELR